MQSSFENKPCVSHSIFSIYNNIFEDIIFLKLNFHYQFIDKSILYLIFFVIRSDHIQMFSSHI